MSASDLTRPIVGIENRTAQEVFDIMADRIRAAPPAIPVPPGTVEPTALVEDAWRTFLDLAGPPAAHYQMAFVDAANSLVATLSSSVPPETRGMVTGTREEIAKAIYDLDPFYESPEYVDNFAVSPGGNLTWEQALSRDAEFASVPHMLPVTKFAFDAADAVLALSRATGVALSASCRNSLPAPSHPKEGRE